MSAFSFLSEFWQTMLPFIMLVEIVLEIGLFMYQLLRSNKPVRSLLSLAVMAVMIPLLFSVSQADPDNIGDAFLLDSPWLIFAAAIFLAAVHFAVALPREYRRISSTDPDRAKTLLAEIAVLCSYIKRRKHLTLLTDRDIKILATELHRAFNESLQTLKLLGVRSSLYVDESLSMLSGKTATAVFDFYESVIEADILNLTGIQVSLIKGDGLRLSLNVCCKADLSALVSGDGIRCEKEDDEEYQRLVFEAKEGDGK